MRARVKNGSNIRDIPESWRAKFREWGSIGGRRGRREDKVRAARKSWEPGGGNYHRRKQPQQAQPEATTPQPNGDTELKKALSIIGQA